MKFLKQREAFGCDGRRGTGRERCPPPSPHDRSTRGSVIPQPAASPLSLQAALSTRVAAPRGFVSKLKMECDDQFFLSGSLNPHCSLIALTTSRASSSGPFSNNPTAVAGSPSMVNPSTLKSPQCKY